MGLFYTNLMVERWNEGQNLPSSHHHIICELCLLSIYTSNYELWHANWNGDYHIIGYYLLSCKRLYESMWLCDFLWIESDFFFFFNFCFIASCLKCIRFQFSGKLKRFSVKTSSVMVGCRNCPEEMCHHLFLLYI